MAGKINLFKEGRISDEKMNQTFQGWKAYALWADSHNLIDRMQKILP